ncbi:MAG: hypothetical protein HY928_02280 [Elusimicrobia bacterium]|nr:hypothetical protein [Elusimicrobiota bacterium]
MGPLLIAAILAAGGSASAAGLKSFGTTEVPDDLTSGSSGGQGMTDGTAEVEGAFGQAAAGDAASGSSEVEAGYFARAVTAPTNVSWDVWQSTLTLKWSDAAVPNPAGTLYTAEFSTAPDFSGTLRSSQTTGFLVTIATLAANSTHYARIMAEFGGTEVFAYVYASTVSAIEMPGTVYIDEVSSHAIVAAAFVGGTSFSSMTAGLSGTNIFSTAINDYGGWRKEGWTTLAPAPAMNARNQVAGAVLGGKFYTLGGSFAAATGDTQEYDPVSNAWTSRASMRPRNLPAAAVYGGRIYVIGGFDGSPLTANQRYDPESNAWTWLSSMPVAGRSGAAAAVAAGEIFVIGGNAGVGDVDTVQSYDPEADTWTARSPMPTARSGVRAVELGGMIYAIGGNGPLSANEVYNPGTGDWASRAPMISSRAAVALVRLGGKIIAAGGDLGGSESGDTDEYDAAADTWTRRASLMPKKRYNAAAGVLGGRLFVAGGWNTVSGSLSQTDLFDPGTTQKFAGLTANTQYFFTAKARNSAGVETAEAPTVSTYTLAMATMPAGALFSAVYTASVTVNWSDGGGGAGASFLVQASTMATFIPAASSMTTGALSATLTGLFTNARHYFRVRAYNSVGGSDLSWFVLGSTVTAIETPTNIYFDEISSTAITAAAYAPNPAFSSMTVGLSGTNIAIAGNYRGWHGEGWTTGLWPMTTARDGGAVEGLGGHIYVRGGNTGGATDANERYDPVTNSWSVATVLPAARYKSPGSAVAGGRIYVLGGANTLGNPVATNYEYDPEGNVWDTRTAMPTPRDHVGVAAVGGRIFAIGGADPARVALNAVYDVATDSWTMKAAMSGPRDGVRAVAVSGKVYVFGGSDGAASGKTEEYDPATDFWATKASMTVARWDFGAALLGGKIYALGGNNPGLVSVTEAYDPLSDTWTARSPIPTPRATPMTAQVGGRLYAIGGNNGPKLDTNERFDAGVASSFTALLPNTLYDFTAKARNSIGVETAETGLVSTYTYAAVPGQHANPFPQVFISSVQVQWLQNGNPSPATKYRVQASTASDFNAAAAGAVVDWDTAFSTYAVGLTGNTTYYFRVQARNVHGVQTGYLVMGQAATTPFPPAGAVSTFSAVFGTSLDLSWDANGNGSGTLYEAVVSTQPLPNALTNVSVTTRPAGALSVTMSPLISNATYYAAVRAISHSGAPTAFTALGSTLTRVNPPVTAVTTFTAVYQSSFTTAWGGNGNNVGTRYETVASTATPLDLADPANVPISTEPFGAEGADIAGLGANTTYYFFVAARARTGELTPYTALGSTVTSAAVPASAASTFTLVESSSLMVSWSANANALGTPYTAVLSTQTPLTLGLPGNKTVSTAPWGPPSAAMTGLLDNTTYFLFAAAFDRAGAPTAFTALGSTVTDAATPSEVYFDSVSSYSLVAVASGPAGGYTNLAVSSSAIGFSSGGVFQGWVSGSSVAVFSGLIPNSSYTFTAKARNQAGTETPESPSVSTYTLAAVPSSQTATFTAIWQSSAAFQWAAGGNPAGTEFEASASTDSLFGGGSSVFVSTWQVALSTAFSGLTVNATYYFRARARNFYGNPTAYQFLGSTVTGASVPAGPSGAASTFTAVGSTYMTVNWDANGNPAGTQYLARLSTAASFGGGAQVIEYAWTTLSSETFVNLSTDTVYYAAVRARNHALVESDFHFLGSTATPVAIPAASTAPFHSVGVTSVTVQWTSNGNPPSTLYEVLTATSTSFTGWGWSSGFGAMLSTTTPSLFGDTTYYWRVRAKGVSGTITDVLHLGSTVTLAAPPLTPALRSVGPSSVRLDWGTGGNREADALSAWAFDRQLPQGRERHGAAWVNGRVYVIGGIVSGVPSAEVWSASAAADGTLGVWRAEASLPAARESHAVAAFAGRLYVVGGFDGVPKKTVYWASVGTDGMLGDWFQGSDLPAARYKLAAAADGGWLYALGGDNGIVSQTAVYAAPLASDGAVGTWALAGNLPSARNSHAAAAAGGRVFVAGGLGAGVEASVWSVPLAGPGLGVWSTGADMGIAVFRHALVATPGALLSIGGHDGNAGVSTVQAAPVDAAGAVGAWSSRSLLNQARFGHAAVWDGRALLAFGGSDGAAALSSTELAAPAGAEYLAERARDTGFSTDYASSSWRGGSAAELGGLTPNTTYYFQVRSRSRTGAAGPPVSAGSTVTLAAAPLSVASTFTLVEAGSITVNWAGGGNPAGTEFLTALATATVSFGPLPSSGWTTALSSAVFGLNPNTTYYALAVARNSLQAVTPAVFLGSTVTLAAVPTGVDFDSVQAAGFRVFWSTAGNPAGTRYEAQASTVAAFTTLDSSTVTTSSSAVLSGLLGAATYYLRVRAFNWTGTAGAFSLTASTVTGQDLVAPGAATDLTANPTETPGTMTAAWTVSGDDGASGALTAGSRFYVQWAAAPAASVSWSTANAQVSASTGPVQPGARAGLLVTGLPVGSWVSMRVWTLDEVGNVSALSNAAYALVSPFTLSVLDGAGTDAGRGASLALDRTGNAHAAYTAGTAAQELRYMTSSGGIWSAAESPDPGTPSGEPVIAQGPGVPNIVFRNTATGQLRHARRAGAWAAAAVASGDLFPGGLAVDSTGYAHLSYYDRAAGDLRYAYWDGTAWQTEAVATAGDVGKFSSLALDPKSRPVVVYFDPANARLMFATRSVVGLWSGSVVDAGVGVGSTPVVALGPSGEPFVAYIDDGAKLLKAAAWDGTAWSVQIVDSFAGGASVGGAALDGAGNLLVSYHDASGGDLRLARWTGTGWSTGTIASLGSVGEDSDLAVDASGGLSMLFYDASAGDLKAASWAAGLAVPAGGNSRGSLGAPSAFSGTVASSNTVQWLWTDSAANEVGWRIYGGLSSTGPFSLVASTTALPGAAGLGTQFVYNETGLTSGTTYFRYAVAVTSGGAVMSPMAAAVPMNTADVTPPTITPNQSGDAVWRKADGATYDVDFVDPGGSGLASFSVKASTRSGGVGPDLIGFTAVASGGLGEAYSANWALPAGVFTALLEGVTNYITVQAIDGNGNTSVRTDAFYVLKDTTVPTVDDFQGDDATPRSAGGTLYNVDARDAGAGLERFQYSVSTTPLAADGAVLAWTDISLAAGTTRYAADWSISFAPLLSGTSNFVSVRAIDRAGSTTTVVDAFFVRKDTTGPSIAVSTPAAGFPSVLGPLSGTAADPSGIASVLVAIQSGGLWWDGALFASVSQTWLAASGTAAWTYASVPAWTDGTAYRVIARASDTAGNFSALYSTRDFTLDASSPAVSLTVPAPEAALSSLASLSGTAADAGAGLAWIRVSLRRASDAASWDWNASGWSAAAVSTTPALAASWTLPVSEALRSSLANGASYFVSAWAADLAVPANTGGLASGATAFHWSDSVPPAAVTDLTALSGSAPASISLSWTAPGDDGQAGTVATGEFRVHYSSAEPVAFSSAAAGAVLSTAAVVPGSRHGTVLTGLEAGATYFLRVFFSDDSGNWSTLSNGATAMATPEPFNQIWGHVVKTSSEGITGVLVEAYDAAGTLVSSTNTVNDSSGTFKLRNIPAGAFKVQATWTAGDITSSVWLDGIAQGSVNVDFILQINYTLATLTGTIGSQAAQAASPAGFLARAAEDGFRQSRVELLRNGRSIVETTPDPTGRWTISNLLPGRYAVRAFNGLEYTEPQDVELGEGETREVVLVFDPLPEAQVFAFPNPARERTTVRFVSGLPGLEAQVSIFDIAGVLVREIPGSSMVPKPGGLYHAAWDLANDRGEAVASGVYLVMVKVRGSNGQSGKVIKKLAVVR